MIAALIPLFASLVAALPSGYDLHSQLARQNGPSDDDILQYALTLEHIEARFYKDALAKFSADDFAAAGYEWWVRGRYAEIGEHEADHVQLLSSVLGDAATQPCEYSFPYTDVTSFIGLATLIENVGTSAYSGAARYISNGDYVTVAAVILTTEARHQSWQSSAVGHYEPWSSAYDTPLGLDMVFTLASGFITSCPSSNPSLPVMAFGALTVDNGTPGQMATFTFNGTGTNYAVFYNGVGMQAVALDSNNMAMVPAALQGISYVVISSASDPKMVDSTNIVAGPAFVVNHFTADAANPPFTGM